MIVKCPNCQREVSWESNPFRPFCSERCKLIDLGHWADEDYAVASEDNSPSRSEADHPDEPVRPSEGPRISDGSGPERKRI